MDYHRGLRRACRSRLLPAETLSAHAAGVRTQASGPRRRRCPAGMSDGFPAASLARTGHGSGRASWLDELVCRVDSTLRAGSSPMTCDLSRRAGHPWSARHSDLADARSDVHSGDPRAHARARRCVRTPLASGQTSSAARTLARTASAMGCARTDVDVADRPRLAVEARSCRGQPCRQEASRRPSRQHRLMLDALARCRASTGSTLAPGSGHVGLVRADPQA